MIGILGDGLMANAIGHLLLCNGKQFDYFSRKIGNISQVEKCETVFVCVPSAVLVELSKSLQNINVISCAKGVAVQENCFISSFFSENRFAVLSGPNFANEILQSKKTITTVASKNQNLLKEVENLIACEFFSVEKTQNVKGVELCGILKNAIAILMGYASVKNPSWNERSLILTHLFQEMKKVLNYFDCNEDVLSNSCGIGDVFLTCSTTNSRNFNLGVSLANGGVDACFKTVEGVRSLQFLKTLTLEIPYFIEGANLLDCQFQEL